jgi:hypothetical protein
MDPLDNEDDVFNDTMQRKELMFGVNGDDVIEEMLSDDDGGGNDDSGAEEFDRNQSGDEGGNANGENGT